MNARSWMVMFFASVTACGGAAGANGTTAASASSKTYPIHLHRPAHVGARTHFVSEAVEDNTSVMHLASSGKELSHDHMKRITRLDAVATTIALDERQDELRATLDVKTLSVDGTALIQDKRVDITKAKKADDAIATIDGAPLSAEQRKALKDVLSLRVGGPTDDDIFGTTEPQPVGAHWPMDAERARADLMEDTALPNKNVSGETTFGGIERVGNLDALRVEAKMEIDGIDVPVPPGATCEPGHAKASFRKLVPVDEDRGVLASHMEFEMRARIHAATPTGDDVVGDIVATSRQDDTMTPL